jgi:ubiquinone/menaquinone biosynthesis C-methylase UbiE
MNTAHVVRLSSREWREYLERELVPWVLGAAPLGDDVVEIGPGPGLTTDLFRARVARLTAVEVDDDLAAALRDRLDQTNVEVLTADATCTGLPADRFSAATCFTMLHHVPTAAAQDALLAEVRRVLRPGARFLGTDVLDTPALRDLHIDDVYVPIDPDTLSARLERAGFVDVQVELATSISPVTGQPGGRVRFDATKPG